MTELIAEHHSCSMVTATGWCQSIFLLLLLLLNCFLQQQQHLLEACSIVRLERGSYRLVKCFPQTLLRLHHTPTTSGPFMHANVFANKCRNICFRPAGMTRPWTFPSEEEFFYVGLRTLICPVCHWERSKVDWCEARMQAVVRGEQIVQQWQKAHVPAALGSHSRLDFSFAFETMRNGSHFSFNRDRKCSQMCSSVLAKASPVFGRKQMDGG